MASDLSQRLRTAAEDTPHLNLRPLLRSAADALDAAARREEARQKAIGAAADACRSAQAKLGHMTGEQSLGVLLRVEDAIEALAAAEEVLP